MRSLVIRFEDCEGPGIIESILKDEGYSITYLDAFKESQTIMPGTHLLFDFFLFMGGSASVYDPEKQNFFHSYTTLIKDILDTKGKKILGVCLGSQILAKAIGAEVSPGKFGKEIGLGFVEIENSSDVIFSGIDEKILPVIHFHGDVFSLPEGTSNLMSSKKYKNQMFSNGTNIYGILPHFEVTETMFYVWKERFPEFRTVVDGSLDVSEKIQHINSLGRIIFKNIIKKS